MLHISLDWLEQYLR